MEALENKLKQRKVKTVEIITKKTKLKKTVKRILIVIAIVIACGIISYIVYIRFPSKYEKDAPIFSANAIRHEYSSNNMLGLKAITIDGDKYIYEFSAYKYFTRRKVDDLYRSNKIRADGSYEREIIGIIDHQIDDIDVFASENSTYVVVVPEKGKGKYIGIELYFNKWYFNSRKKHITVLHVEDGTSVNETVFYYKKDHLVSMWQGYLDGKWGKKSKFGDSIWEYECMKDRHSKLW